MVARTPLKKLKRTLSGRAEHLDSIGEEVRYLRRSRGVTIQALAERTGRSVGFISQIERGVSKPSLKDLYAISVCLGVQVGWFLRDVEPPPAHERGILVRRKARRTYTHEGIKTALLSPYMGQEVELMQSVFSPGAATEERTAAHKGREAGVVLKGQLELWVGGRKFLLDEGDSYSYLSTTPHWSRNPTDSETIVIWVVTPA